MYPFEQALIWHVIFHPERRWWGGEFSHVSLAGFANNTWLHLDLYRGGVSVAPIYHYDEVHEFLSFLLWNYTVVRFGPSQEKSRGFLRPMTCVAFTKHVLGIKSSALRPDALFRDLTLNYGAKVLNETQGDRDSRAETATAEG